MPIVAFKMYSTRPSRVCAANTRFSRANNPRVSISSRVGATESGIQAQAVVPTASAPLTSASTNIQDVSPRVGEPSESILDGSTSSEENPSSALSTSASPEAPVGESVTNTFDGQALVSTGELGSSEPVGTANSEGKAAQPKEVINLDDFPVKLGDIVSGRVVFSNSRGARVALHGVKGVLGYLPKNRGPIHLRDPRQQAGYVNHNAQCIPHGTTRRFKVIALPPDMTKGGKGPLLACSDIDSDILWNRIEQIKQLGTDLRETVRVVAFGAVDKGLLVNLSGARGFLPVSHVVKQPGQDWLAKEDLEKMIGQELEVSLMNINRERFNFSCSMMNAVSDRKLRQLRIGSLVWGTVRRMTDYGVFVSIEETYETALLHITNVSWHRVPTMDSVFSVGDRVRSVVIGMDEGFSRLSVSTRDLEETEGDMLHNPQKVYDNAERGVERFLEHVRKWESEQSAQKDSST